MAFRRLASVLFPAVFVFLAGPLIGQTGDLRVVVSTSGATVDPDGYVVALDSLRQAVSVNGSVAFIKVTLGNHTTMLLDVAEGCVIREGNPKMVMIAQGGIAEVRFKVVCGQGEPDLPSVRREPLQAAVEPLAAPLPSALPMGYFLAGLWVTVVEPPDFPSYPVHLTIYSEQALGEVVGEARYESTSPCKYDLLLEYVGDNDMVLVQQLVSGDCAKGTRIVLRRGGKRLRGQWLKVDKSAWFGADLQRHSSPYRIP